MSISPAGIESWPHAFARLRLAPSASTSVPGAAAAALVYVVDGVLQLDEGPGALRRALPGELVICRSGETLPLANGSRRDELDLCVMMLADSNAVSGTRSRYFSDDDKSGALCVMASRDGAHGSLASGGAMTLSMTSLSDCETVVHALGKDVRAFVYVIAGSVLLDQVALDCGAGAHITKQDELRISGRGGAQMLLLEQPGG